MIWTILPKLMGRRRNTALAPLNWQDAPDRRESGTFVGELEVAKERQYGAFKIIPFDAIESESGSEHVTFNAVARRAADASCDRLLEISPSLFVTIAPGCDLAGAYRAWLTYRYLQTEVVRLAALSQRRDLVETSVLVVQTAVPAPILTELLLGAGRPQDAPDVRTISGLPAPELAILLAASSKWLADDISASNDTKDRAGVAFVAGTPAEVDWMCEAVALAKPPASTIIIKKKREDLVAAVKKNKAKHQLTSASWRGLGHRCLKERDHARLLGAMRSLFEALALDENEPLRPHGVWVLNFLAHAVSVVGLDYHFKPRLVVGSLEKSPIGLVLSALGPAMGIRTFTVQHGNIAPQGMLDLVRFDRFGVWDESARRTILADGYPDDAVIRLVGRPPSVKSGDAVSDQADHLREWMGGRRAVVLFLQPLKPPHVSMAALVALLDHALEIVRSSNRHVLLVKPHPRNSAEEIRIWRTRVGSDATVSFLNAERSTMNIALELCDVALSLNSTALSDAAAAGRRAVAFETREGVGATQLGLPPEVHIARSFDELRSLVSEAGKVESVKPAEFVPAVASVIAELI